MSRKPSLLLALAIAAVLLLFLFPAWHRRDLDVSVTLLGLGSTPISSAEPSASTDVSRNPNGSQSAANLLPAGAGVCWIPLKDNASLDSMVDSAPQRLLRYPRFCRDGRGDSLPCVNDSGRTMDHGMYNGTFVDDQARADRGQSARVIPPHITKQLTLMLGSAGSDTEASTKWLLPRFPRMMPFLPFFWQTAQRLSSDDQPLQDLSKNRRIVSQLRTYFDSNLTAPRMKTSSDVDDEGRQRSTDPLEILGPFYRPLHLPAHLFYVSPRASNNSNSSPSIVGKTFQELRRNGTELEVRFPGFPSAVEVFSNATAGEKESVGGGIPPDMDDLFQPYTAYAQEAIARSQLGLGATGRAAENALDTDDFCSQRRLLVTPTENTLGLGGAILWATHALSHAIILDRSLVFFPRWRRWTNNRQTDCHGRGWECFFLPPSPCEYHLHGESWNKTVSRTVGSKDELRTLGDYRVLVKRKFRHKDLTLDDWPRDLLPPGVSPLRLEEMLRQRRSRMPAREGSAVLSFREWAQAQLVRYLVRGLQPWTEVMVLNLMQSSGFPFDEQRTADDGNTASKEAPTPAVIRPYIVAAHFRNGENLKDREMAHFLRCRKVDVAFQLLQVEVLRRHVLSLGRSACSTRTGEELSSPNISALQHRQEVPVRFFFSFDAPSILEDAKVFWGDSDTSTDESSSLADSVLIADVPLNFETSAPGEIAVSTGGNETSGGSPSTDLADISLIKQTTERKDSRKTMARAFGVEHVIKVSLVNLFLAVNVDAWCNNDASNWSVLINYLRLTTGGFASPYIDTRYLAKTYPELFSPFCVLPWFYWIPG